MSTTEITAEPGAHDLTITRTFAAPRDLVYRCWADPRLLERWLGPHSLSTEVTTWEIDASGPWRFVSHAGPWSSPLKSWLPAASALLPPSLSQSSGLLPLACVESTQLVPVLRL